MSVKDNMLSFTTPDSATTDYIAYTVKDKAGLSDTATLTVNVDPNAAIEPPTAYDYRVPSAATIDKVRGCGCFPVDRQSFRHSQ